MKLPTYIRYGVRALCDIAYNSGGMVTRVRSISERQDISQRYIEQIFQKLKKGGIVRSVRGPDGGYYLTRKPGDISIGDVIRAIDGQDIQLVPCKGGGKRSRKACPRYGTCVVSDVWTGATLVLADYFNSISLGEICAETRRREKVPGDGLEDRAAAKEMATVISRQLRMSGVVPSAFRSGCDRSYPRSKSRTPKGSSQAAERKEAGRTKSVKR